VGDRYTDCLFLYQRKNRYTMQGIIRRQASRFYSSSSRVVFSDMPTTTTPPPNAARGATADLCDIYVTDPVDKITSGGVQIAQPIFKCVVA
jgi:hypothetical protein